MKTLTEKEALGKAAAYCSQAEHCRSEVDEKLNGWGVAPDIRERILSRLEKEKYIDENRYCRFFIHDKLRYNKWGRNKIAQALWLKKIPSDISAPLLAGMDADEYREVLHSLLEAKRPTVNARNTYELVGKLMRFALGRGFEIDEIRRCLAMKEADEWVDD